MNWLINHLTFATLLAIVVLFTMAILGAITIALIQTLRDIFNYWATGKCRRCFSEGRRW